MYLIFDVETHVDVDRVLRTQHPIKIKVDGVLETDAQCADRFLAELCAKTEQVEGCFSPARYQAPNTVVMLWVQDDMTYAGHHVLDYEKNGRADVERIAFDFWKWYTWFSSPDVVNQYGQTMFVSFNGTKYDFPVMEIAGIEARLPMGSHFRLNVKPWEDPRVMGNTHLDIYSYLNPRGRSAGGELSYWSRLIGLPGKVESNGATVKALLDAKQKDAVADYCICDVLNTYGLLYHLLYTMGKLTTSYRGPVFEDVLARMSVGRSTEVERFKSIYASQGLF